MKLKNKFLNRSLLLVAAFISPLLSQQAQAQNAELRAYSNSLYGFCDAKKVASVWNKGIGDAKAIIGGKILGNLTHLIDADIASTRNSVRCSYADTQLQYKDAEKLGQHWGVSANQAKTMAATKMSATGTKLFYNILRGVL
ncbi:hypothetical protein [Cohaesibacter celericrescens]|uniref:hypothetical protein n=1 Tax=Cohaesibacter celericrescens TaxID=2067669 RepID=UPI003563B637